MKWCSFREQGRESYGVQVAGGKILDLKRLGQSRSALDLLASESRSLLSVPDLKSFLAQGKPALDAARQLAGGGDRVQTGLEESGALLSASEVTLQAPIPNPGKIVAVGLNYRDHAEEQNVPLPSRPLIFAKFPTAVASPGQPIELPAISRQVDVEAELCVVILATTRGVTPEEASHSIAGYTAGNDVSARDLQYSDRQWVRGKSCDTFAPMGPFLVSPDEIGDPHALDIELQLNGRVQQQSNTANLIFNCFELVAFISESITLEPGDIIFTGTPAGVGMFRNPQVFLQPGDRVEIRIEKIGTLFNPVVEASARIIG